MFGILVLMLIIAFSVVSIAGNFLKHEGIDRRPATDNAREDFVPRVLALSVVRTKDQKAA